EGAGLGIRFLKHLTRTRLLLHLVDILPVDGSDPADNARAIEQELAKFSPTLAQRDRWLVLNKFDRVPAEEAEQRCRDVVEKQGWQGPVFNIAAISKVGTSALSTAIMEYIEDRREQESHDPDAARAELEVQHRMQQEARERIEALRLQRSRGEVP